ncbi:MAG: hypothetical protein RSA20_01805 [Oscillospiraceae bacterium]
MYFFKKNPDASETIRYVDFELKVEIALCSKPECQHNSNTCNACFPYMGGSHNLVLSDDKLYVLFSAADEQWIEKYGDSAIAHIEKMDLDGGNREYLCEIPNMLPNSGFDGYVFDDKKIYIMCNTAKKQGDGVTVEPNLLSIDQNSGQIEVEASNDSLSGIKNPRIFGTNKDNIILCGFSEGGLSDFNLFAYNLSNKSLTELMSWNNSDSYGVFYQEELILFSRHSGEVSTYEILTGKLKNIWKTNEYEDIKSIGIRYIIDRNFFGYITAQNGTMKHFSLNLDTGEIIDFGISILNAEELDYAEIRSQHQNYYIVTYMQEDRVIEFPELNGKSTKLLIRDYNLAYILKSDFEKKQPNFIPVEQY